MIRVLGTIQSPIDSPIPYTSLLIQAISGSTEVLPNAYAHIELDETGEYDFPMLNGTYRIYANYENSTKIDVIGECIVGNGMQEDSYTLNQLVSNFTPVAPDWVTDLDNEWQGKFDQLVNDANTNISNLQQAITDGDAQVVQDMTTYTNDELEALGASMTEYVQAGNATVLNQSKAYTDSLGNEVANEFTSVSNSVSSVSSELTAYKSSNDTAVAEINDRISLNEASLGSSISAEVDYQTGQMELRINQVIQTNNASLESSMSLLEDELGNVQAEITNTIDTEIASINESMSVISGTVDSQGNLLDSQGDAISDLETGLATQVAAWQVTTSVAGLKSAIGMVNTGSTSTIYLQADSLVLTNDNDNITVSKAPFYVQGGQVYIDTATITNLTGDNISSTATIIAGSGSSQAGMNGLDSGIYSGWRFWAGSATPSSAPYRVTSAGMVYATKMHISGDSTFAGTLNGADGVFSGTIYTKNLVGGVTSVIVKPIPSNSYTGPIAKSKWLDILSFTVVNSYDFDRVLIVSPVELDGFILILDSSSSGFTCNYTWRLYSPSLNKTYYSSSGSVTVPAEGLPISTSEFIASISGGEAPADLVLQWRYTATSFLTSVRSNSSGAYNFKVMIIKDDDDLA